MAENCPSCRKAVLDDDEALLCDHCEKWWHRICLDMSKTTYKKHEKSKNEWLCPKCERENIGDVQSSKNGIYTISDIMDKLTEMDKKYTKLFERYEEQIKINMELKKELHVIKRTLNAKEQQDLNNNIIIQGIPLKENEKAEVGIEKIARALNIANDAEKIYRLGSGNGSKTVPVKVVFKNAEDKKKWMVAKKTKNLTSSLFESTNNPTPIFINHDLTKQNLQLFKTAKQFKKDHDYKYVWINNGKILLRKSDTSKILLIEEESDLKN